MTTYSPKETRRLLELRKKATPGPWGEDDGSIFSEPLSDERYQSVMDKIHGIRSDCINENECGGPYGFIATTRQQQPNFENDSVFIASIHAIADQLTAAQAVIEKQRALLARYRAEVPSGSQPYMLAHEVDVALRLTEDET